MKRIPNGDDALSLTVTEPAGTRGPNSSVFNTAQRRAVASDGHTGEARMGPQAPRASALADTRGGWWAAPAPSLVPYGPRPAQDGHEAWADVVVVAHVLVLLLTPHQLHAWVLLCLSLDQVERKRRDLGQVRKNEGHSQWKGGMPTVRPPREQPPPPSLALPPAHCPEPGGWRFDLAHHSSR